MRLLMLEWDSFAHEYVAEEWKREGYEVDSFSWPFPKENMRENEALCHRLSERIREEEYAFVFSFNFFPVAAKVCEECRIRYVAWIYDTPYLLLYSQYALSDTSYLFFFDKSQCISFREHGVKNAFYLPMAAPVDYYDKMLVSARMQEEIKNYYSEISFVGSTYSEERQDFFRYLDGINDYTSGYLDAIMKMQGELYGSFLLEELLNDNILRELKRVCPLQKGEDEWETDAWIYANYFLARKLTGDQRREQLELLGRQYEVKLYAPKESKEVPYVINCGPVDYVKEMPLVFKNSKINLNMTLRSIHTGIPLRAMDIMGCGGFLLTNYQEDFLEYFEPDVDFVYYSGREELLQLVDYYLNHEEEREEIARNGYQRVKQYHTYRYRIRQILAILGEIEEETEDKEQYGI